MSTEKDAYPKIFQKQLQHWQYYKKLGDSDYLAAIKLLCQYANRFSFYIPGVSYLEQLSRVMHLKYRHHLNPVSRTLEDHDSKHNLSLVLAENYYANTTIGLLETLFHYLKVAGEAINLEGDLHAIIEVIQQQCHLHVIDLLYINSDIQAWKNRILFYHNNEPNDFYSNLSPLPVVMCLEGTYVTAQSSEAIYQGMKGYVCQELNPENKAPHREAGLAFMRNPNPPGAYLQQAGKDFDQNVGLKFHALLPNTSGLTVKEALMIDILLMKATQHVALTAQLLLTGRLDIVENTQLNEQINDPFWGNGQKANGRNRLGHAWMVVRKILHDELKATGHIKMRFELSKETCHALGIPDTRYQVTDCKIQSYDIAGYPCLSTTAEIKQREKALSEPYNSVLLAQTKVTKNYQHYITHAIQTEFASIFDVRVSDDGGNNPLFQFYFKSKEEANAFAIKATSALLFKAMTPTKRVDHQTQHHIVILDSLSTKAIFNHYKVYYGLGFDIFESMKLQQRPTAGLLSAERSLNL